MEYGMLSGKIQTFAGIVQMLLVTASAWMFVRACSLRLSKKILAFTFLFLSVQILFLQAVSDVTVVMTTGKKGTLLARVAGHGPAGLVLSILAVSVLTGIFQWLFLYKKSRDMITTRSIKESIDLLPDGVCFSTDRGMPILMNSRMRQLCTEFTGEGLMDTEKFWRDLRNGNVRKGIRPLKQREAAFIDTNGQVWDFRRSRLSYGGEKVTEISAVNITTQYHLHKDLVARYERLNDVNSRLHHFSEEVEKVTREKEILAAKIKLHDEIGRSLLILRSYLTETPEKSAQTETPGKSAQTEKRDRSRLLPLWQYIVTSMQEGTILKEREDSLLLLKKEAADFNVDIFLEGLLPANPSVRNVIFAAVRECAGNTAKHARGDRLFITIHDTEENTEVFITNNGNAPGGSIHETGGLKNLRKMVEERGGSMQIKSSPVFVLHLCFPERGGNTEKSESEGTGTYEIQSNDCG
mgnify:CR=1 FL=1